MKQRTQTPTQTEGDEDPEEFTPASDEMHQDLKDALDGVELYEEDEAWDEEAKNGDGWWDEVRLINAISML